MGFGEPGSVLEEAACRRAGRWRRVLTCAARGEDFEPDAVRILEEDSARVRAFGVRDDAAMERFPARRAQPLLEGPHLGDRIDGEREVMETRSRRREPAIGLLPQGQNQAVAVAQKRKRPALPLR